MARRPPMTAEDKAWRARSDADTLRAAQEIMADKTRHGAAKAHAAKEIARLQSVVKTPIKTRGRK